MSEFQNSEISNNEQPIAIVTGANAGLGFETTKALAAKDFKVIMACRDLEKAKEARQQILNWHGNAKLEILELDLASLESVRSFASKFKTKNDQLDLLINNAGVMMPPYQKTEDGFELQLGVNYLGHFLLTDILRQVQVMQEVAWLPFWKASGHSAKRKFNLKMILFCSLQMQKKLV